LWSPSSRTQYIKPLPRFYARASLDFDKLQPRAIGLLYSYMGFVQSELDYDLANELKLLPPAAAPCRCPPRPPTPSTTTTETPAAA
jgi:hypothetical protein